MKKIIEVPHITAIASSNAWKPITPFGTVNITEEKKNTISKKEIANGPSERWKYKINLEFDFPGLEGGSQENIESMYVVLQVGARNSVIDVSTRPELINGIMYFRDDMLFPDSLLIIESSTHVWYPDEDYVLHGPTSYVKVIE